MEFQPGLRSELVHAVMHQSIPAVPIPPPGNRGAFTHVVSPGDGTFAIYCSPGAEHLLTPGRPPGI